MNLSDIGKKKLSIDEIQSFFKIEEYLDLVKLINEKTEANEIMPVKASGLNGKRPVLFNKYRLIEQKDNTFTWKDELNYKVHPKLSIDYYRNHPDKYQSDRAEIFMLSDYLTNKKQSIQIPFSINERSFEIFHREKYLDQGGGKLLLKNLRVSLEELNVYEAREPIAYYSHHKEVPQNIVIVENMDTFYSMRKHLLEGNVTIFGVEIGSIIYGRGKGIIKAFYDFKLCAEPYMLEENNIFLYFGDLDYEGIRIYEGFYYRYHNKYRIKPFVEGYQCMLKKGQMCMLPMTKEGQSEGAHTAFFDEFLESEQEEINQILRNRTYIPQEIVNIMDF